MVCAYGVVAHQPQHGALAKLVPHLQMEISDTLPEVTHRVDGEKICQKVGGNLAARVLGLIQVHVDIYQHDGELTLEARQGLL